LPLKVFSLFTNSMRNRLKEKIRERAESLGFDLFGVSKPDYSPEDHNHFLRWLDKDYHGQMSFIARKPRLRCDPELFSENVKSIISVGVNYYNDPGFESDKPYISIYARNKPYQEVIRDRLNDLLSFTKEHSSCNHAKIAVDTSPTLDKHWAIKSGLGWRGKNSLVLNEKFGSFIFLGEIFIDIELPPDDPVADKCGDCQLCIEACPTGALFAPYSVDASKCVSYLNLEASTPLENPELIENNLFGCDHCQLVCPYNQDQNETIWPEFKPIQNWKNLLTIDWTTISTNEFKSRYLGTIIERFGYIRYVNNAQAVRRNINQSNKI